VADYWKLGICPGEDRQPVFTSHMLVGPTLPTTSAVTAVASCRARLYGFFYFFPKTKAWLQEAERRILESIDI